MSQVIIAGTAKKTGVKKMNRDTIILSIVAILLIVSVLQTFQLGNLVALTNAKVAAGSVQPAGSSVPTGGAITQPQTGNAQLPGGMIGGC